MGVQVTNNAASKLAGSIDTVVTSLSVTATEGAKFPAVSTASGNYFYATLIDTAGNIEIVKVTDRVTDTFTIVRARDGTTAKSFSANDRVELRPVAGLFNDLPNRLLQTADYADASITTAKLAVMGSVTPNTYGGPGKYTQFTVNSKGQVTAASESSGALQQTTFAYTGGAQTWTKPAGGTWALIELWGGGGSGGKGRANSAAGGGGGGRYIRRLVLLSTLGATETVNIGAGGAAQASADSNGNPGGATTFGTGPTLVTAYGGGPGMGTDVSGNNGGGHGGGIGAVGGTQAVASTALALNSSSDTPGGRYGASTAGEAGASGEHAGGGGGACNSGTSVGGAGGNSTWGGAGGGAASEVSSPAPGAGGTSQFGGNGGAGAFDSNNATAGSVPGGGGGGAEQGTSGAGGNGRAIITVF
jgi:hypothetical protein